MALDRNKPVSLHEIMLDDLEQQASAEIKKAHLKTPKDSQQSAPQWSLDLSSAAGKVERTGIDQTTVDGQPRAKP